MTKAIYTSAFISLLLAGAIFGFFYAWVCSTMWGLDALPASQAIAAMNAMNASVRNAVFFPAFFLTPLAAFVTAILAYLSGYRTAAAAFALAGIIYVAGGIVLTANIHIPMNTGLADVTAPFGAGQAEQIWAEYSPRWQFWNQVRAGFSGLALLAVGAGLLALGRATGGHSR